MPPPEIDQVVLVLHANAWPHGFANACGGLPTVLSHAAAQQAGDAAAFWLARATCTLNWR